MNPTRKPTPTFIENLNRLQKARSFEELEKYLLDLFMDVTEAGGGSLIESNGDTFRVRAVVGNEFLSQNRGIPIRLNPNGPLGRVLRTRNALLMRNINLFSGVLPSGYQGYRGDSLLVFPLDIDPDQPFCFITLHSPQGKPYFTHRDLRLGTLLLHQARQAMQIMFLKHCVPGRPEKNISINQVCRSVLAMRSILHNLRNIFTPIYNNITFLLSRKVPPWKQKKLFGLLAESSRHAYRILRQSVVPGSMPREPEMLDCRKIVGECVRLFTNAPVEIRFRAEEPEDTESGYLFWGYRSDIEQMCVNFIKNALEAFQRKGTIQFSLKEINPGKEECDPKFCYRRYLCLSIRDNGCGMDQETLDRIFTPGFSTKASGSGIGLSSIYRTLRRHHALIRIQSILEHGTRIEVFFPSITSLDRNAFLKYESYQGVRLNSVKG